MKITFYGGARSVTGANYLLEHNGVKILVDCGLNQGSRYAEELNYNPFKYDPSEVDHVFITHSHIDHVGRLPKLFKDGFRGQIHVTTATRDLIAVTLPDNMRHITQEAEAEGHEPLFEEADINGVMKLMRGTYYKEEFDLGGGITSTLHDAGHILGSSIVEIRWQGDKGPRKMFFSGDLGNSPTPLLKDAEFVTGADYVVVESAYGDRVHEPREEREHRLEAVIKATIERKGVLMIPSFAVERTQELLLAIHNMMEDGRLPRIPVFVDSPLAIKMTAVYKQHADYFNKEITSEINKGDDIFNFPGLQMTASVDESKAINDVPQPKIIIAGSGMSQGGRIWHHQLRYLPDPNSTILFVGYQVDGSIGRQIQEGRPSVRILGQEVTIRCHRESISSYSAHADQKALLNWVKHTKTESPEGDRPYHVYVVQGEEASAKTLAELIHTEVCVPAYAPKEGESFELA